MEIPSITLPDAFGLPSSINLPRPTLEEPTANLPSYKPMVVAPKVLAPPAGVPTVEMEQQMDEEEKREEEGKPAKPKQEAAEVRRIDIPFTDLKFPVPKEEILVAAGTTASVSVIATLTVTSLFKQAVKVMKPIIKQIATRIQKKFNGNSSGKAEEPSK
tara:strand:+ start:3562 stop:4038 length:477 start_codon:yes stop_codon:yes gene_type:complete